jgi:pyruvate/2-oxoglutarate dehydrogenase complex dihydrolipoamide acyltransferase (E2) component
MNVRTSLAKTVAVSASALLVYATAPVYAATHAVDTQQASARLVEMAHTRQERVDLFQKALAQPEVRDRAASMGVSADKLANAIPHLTDAELEDLAQRATKVQDVAAGHRRHGANPGLIIFGTALLLTAVVVLAVAAGDDDYYDDYYYDDCGCW